MRWYVEKINELDLIQTVYSGDITPYIAEDSTVKTLNLAAEEGIFMLLCDISDAFSKLSILDLYKLPILWHRLNYSRRYTLAVVASENIPQWQLRFFENVTRNRGWKVSIFKERQNAIDWLIEHRTLNNMANKTKPSDIVTIDPEQARRAAIESGFSRGSRTDETSAD